MCEWFDSESCPILIFVSSLRLPKKMTGQKMSSWYTPPIRKTISANPVQARNLREKDKIKNIYKVLMDPKLNQMILEYIYILYYIIILIPI